MLFPVWLVVSLVKLTCTTMTELPFSGSFDAYCGNGCNPLAGNCNDENLSPRDAPDVQPVCQAYYPPTEEKPSSLLPVSHVASQVQSVTQPSTPTSGAIVSPAASSQTPSTLVSLIRTSNGALSSAPSYAGASSIVASSVGAPSAVVSSVEGPSAVPSSVQATSASPLSSQLPSINSPVASPSPSASVWTTLSSNLSYTGGLTILPSQASPPSSPVSISSTVSPSQSPSAVPSSSQGPSSVSSAVGSSVAPSSSLVTSSSITAPSSSIVSSSPSISSSSAQPPSTPLSGCNLAGYPDTTGQPQWYTNSVVPSVEQCGQECLRDTQCLWASYNGVACYQYNYPLSQLTKLVSNKLWSTNDRSCFLSGVSSSSSVVALTSPAVPSSSVVVSESIVSSSAQPSSTLSGICNIRGDLLDTHFEFYSVTKGSSLNDCGAQCLADTHCLFIEYSADDGNCYFFDSELKYTIGRILPSPNYISEKSCFSSPVSPSSSIVVSSSSAQPSSSVISSTAVSSSVQPSTTPDPDCNIVGDIFSRAFNHYKTSTSDSLADCGAQCVADANCVFVTFGDTTCFFYNVPLKFALSTAFISGSTKIISARSCFAPPVPSSSSIQPSSSVISSSSVASSSAQSSPTPNCNVKGDLLNTPISYYAWSPGVSLSDCGSQCIADPSCSIVEFVNEGYCYYWSGQSALPYINKAGTYLISERACFPPPGSPSASSSASLPSSSSAIPSSTPSPAPPCIPRGNLLPNAGFESGSFAPWQIPANNYKWTRIIVNDVTRAHSGSYFMRVAIVAAGALNTASIQIPDFAIPDGSLVSGWAWINPSPSRIGPLSLTLSVDGQIVTGTDIRSGGWQLMSGGATTVSGNKHVVSIDVSYRTAAPGAVFDLDDVRLEVLTPPDGTSFCPDPVKL